MSPDQIALALGLVLKGGCALLVLAFGYAWARQRPVSFLAIFVLLYIVSGIPGFPVLMLSIGPFNVFLSDVYIALLILCALPRLTHLEHVAGWRLPTLAVGLAPFVGLAVWIPQTGLQSAIVFWRDYLLAGAVLLFALTEPKLANWRALTAVTVIPAALAMVPLLMILATQGLWSYAIVNSDSVGGGRPVGSDSAYLLLIAVFVLLLRPEPLNLGYGLLAGVLAIAVLLLQHRSTWVTGAAMVAVWLLRSRPGEDARKFTMRALALGFGAIALWVATSGNSILSRASNDTGTLEWREERWIESLSLVRSTTEWIFGSLLGPTVSTAPDTFQTSAHNMYVSAIELYGILGLVLLLVMLLIASNPRSSLAELGPVAGFGLFVYGFFYDWPPWSGIIIAALLATRIRQGQATDSGSSDLVHAGTSRDPETGEPATRSWPPQRPRGPETAPGPGG